MPKRKPARVCKGISIFSVLQLHYAQAETQFCPPCIDALYGVATSLCPSGNSPEMNTSTAPKMRCNFTMPKRKRNLWITMRVPQAVLQLNHAQAETRAHARTLSEGVQLQLNHAQAETQRDYPSSPPSPRCNLTMPKRKRTRSNHTFTPPAGLQLHYAQAETEM